MVRVVNTHIAPIRILHDETSIIIGGQESIFLPITTGIIKIEHIPLDNENDSLVNKLSCSVLSKTVLNINCSFCFVTAEDNALIIVKNEIREQITEDFGYQYFSVSVKNCNCHISDCELVNQDDVLRLQKIIRVGEACDIFPFTTARAIYRYHKIKRMCFREKVLRYLKEEESKKL